MKKAFHALMRAGAALLLSVLLLPAQGDQLYEALPETAPLTGTIRRPVGASAPQAAFSLEYAYPQFESDALGAPAINAYFRRLSLQVGADADAFDWEDEHVQVRRTCEVTHISGHYVSVIESEVVSAGNGESERLRAHTLSRTDDAGEPLTLSELLKREGWPVDERQASQAVYRLVYDIAIESVENAEGEYLDGLTLEDVSNAFRPETDFYLDWDGNVVFFIGSGEIAGEIAGILRFPFSLAELTSVM